MEASGIIIRDQEAFDAVARWLLRPDAERCYVQSKGGCQYYDESNGNRCAVGVLFSLGVAQQLGRLFYGSVRRIAQKADEPYESDLRTACKQAVVELDGINLELLAALQSVHDAHLGSMYFKGAPALREQELDVGTWREALPGRLAFVAEEFGLTFTPPAP